MKNRVIIFGTLLVFAVGNLIAALNDDFSSFARLR